MLRITRIIAIRRVIFGEYCNCKDDANNGKNSDDYIYAIEDGDNKNDDSSNNNNGNNYHYHQNNYHYYQYLACITFNPLPRIRFLLTFLLKL